MFATTPVTPPFLNKVTISPAGPTANTVPTITSNTTLKILITFFINPPRYIPQTSEIEAPLLRSESIPEK